MEKRSIIPIILAGGLGTRLWPLSCSSNPKQILPLLGNLSLLQETLLRIKRWKKVLPSLIICNHEIHQLVAQQAEEINIKIHKIIVESITRNTAPAICLAAHYSLTCEENPLLLILPSDHFIKNIRGFHKIIEQSLPIIEQGNIVMFGIPPTYPETGYGYLRKGKPFKSTFFYVKKFTEKPSRKIANKYLVQGDYFWNSGIIFGSAHSILNQINKHCREIFSLSKKITSSLKEDRKFIHIPKEYASNFPNISIDKSVLEKMTSLLVTSLDIGWNDLGSWKALWEVHKKDKKGNVCIGSTVLDEVENSYIYAQSRLIVATGIKDCVVIETPEAILVMKKDDSQNLSKILKNKLNKNFTNK